MRLYYAPHTCSLSPLIVLNELDLPHQLIKVDNQTKRTADGRDFRAINPKGYVAALQLENGEVLTEGPAIIQYLADLKPSAGLAPQVGTWTRCANVHTCWARRSALRMLICTPYWDGSNSSPST